MKEVETALSTRGLDIIYDAQCRFCLRSLRFLQRLAGRRLFRLHDGNERELVQSEFPVLAGATTSDAMFAVTPHGEVFRGFFAFRRIMWESPRLYPLLPFFYVPGASLIGPQIYAWVARNRRNFGCSLDGAKVCGIGSGADATGNSSAIQQSGLNEIQGTQLGGIEMNLSIPRSTETYVSGITAELSHVQWQKALAGIFGFLLLAAILAPMRQNFRKKPRDSFPFSYYPMFSAKRGDSYVVNYMLGSDEQGNRYIIPWRYAGSGGHNQTRRQIDRFVREGKAERLCQAVANKLRADSKHLYSNIVSVQVVTGDFRFDDYFNGNKEPLKEKTRASCQVERADQTKELNHEANSQ